MEWYGCFYGPHKAINVTVGEWEDVSSENENIKTTGFTAFTFHLRLSVFQMSLALGRSQSPRQNCPCDEITNILLHDITWFVLCFVQLESLSVEVSVCNPRGVLFSLASEWMRVVEEMCSLVYAVDKKELNFVYWGKYHLVTFSGKLRDKCECISMVHIIKDPQVCTVGRGRITCLCNIIKRIRFYFLVNIFVSFMLITF